MRGFWGPLGLVVSLLLLADSAWAQLQIKQQVFDFGAIYAGQKVRHTFQLTNSGSQSATIGRIRSSCGCTTTQLPQRRLAPGQQVPLQVTFDSRGRRGQVRKQVQVYNSQGQVAVVLTVQGQVQPQLRLQPQRLQFKGTPGKWLQKGLHLHNLGETAIQITRVQATVAGLKVHLPEPLQLAAGQRSQLKVRMRTPSQPGHSRRGYVLVYHSGYASPLRLQVAAQATP